jgi:hypothetical protein
VRAGAAAVEAQLRSSQEQLREAEMRAKKKNAEVRGMQRDNLQAEGDRRCECMLRNKVQAEACSGCSIVEGGVSSGMLHRCPCYLSWIMDPQQEL